MKNHQIFFKLSALILIAAALFCLTYFTEQYRSAPVDMTGGTNITVSQQQVNSTANSPSSQENSENPSSAAAVNVYTVKEYAGHIGVFLRDETTPVEEVDVPISALPPSDRAMLAQGITVDGETALRSLLEDYE